MFPRVNFDKNVVLLMVGLWLLRMMVVTSATTVVPPLWWNLMVPRSGSTVVPPSLVTHVVPSASSGRRNPGHRVSLIRVATKVQVTRCHHLFKIYCSFACFII